MALSFWWNVLWMLCLLVRFFGDGRFSPPASPPARVGSPCFERSLHVALATPHSTVQSSLRPPLLDAAEAAIDEPPALAHVGPWLPALHCR